MLFVVMLVIESFCDIVLENFNYTLMVYNTWWLLMQQQQQQQLQIQYCIGLHFGFYQYQPFDCPFHRHSIGQVAFLAPLLLFNKFFVFILSFFCSCFLWVRKEDSFLRRQPAMFEANFHSAGLVLLRFSSSSPKNCNRSLFCRTDKVHSFWHDTVGLV